MAGQDEVEGIGVAGHDDAVKGRGQYEVVDPGLEPLLLALGDFQVGFGDPDVDLGLGQRGPPGEQLGVGLQDGRRRRVPEREARLPPIGGLEDILGIDHAPLELAVEPLGLRVPALGLGPVAGEFRPGLLEPRLGRLDVGRGHFHDRLGQRDPLAVEHDGRLLRPVVLNQLGHEEVGEHIAFLHLVADVDDPIQDVSVHFRIDRRALVALGEAGLPDDPDDVPDLRLDQPHGRRLADAGIVGLRLVVAPRRRQGGQETEQEPEHRPAAVAPDDPKWRTR